MAPTIGKIILANNPARVVNGSTEHPAIVTAVFGNTLVNCRVFEDGKDVVWYASVSRWDTAGEDYGGPTWRHVPDPGKKVLHEGHKEK